MFQETNFVFDSDISYKTAEKNETVTDLNTIDSKLSLIKSPFQYNNMAYLSSSNSSLSSDGLQQQQSNNSSHCLIYNKKTTFNTLTSVPLQASNLYSIEQNNKYNGTFFHSNYEKNCKQDETCMQLKNLNNLNKKINDSSKKCQCSINKKCDCLINQNQYNCEKCTKNYPINVRRSMDGEESIYNINKTVKRNLKPFNNKLNESDEEKLNSVVETSLSSTNERPPTAMTSAQVINILNSRNESVVLKSSPIPVSSTLVSLLALSKPNNRFIPPPNVTLKKSHLKQSLSGQRL